MKKTLLLIAIITTACFTVKAQHASNSYQLQGEFGVTIGAAHYFGDLNTRARINNPKPAVGIFYRKQFNNYLGMRISAHYAQLGYSDANSNNSFQKVRNLSFNTDILEFAIQGDFNFFKFIPGDPNYIFTPYVTLGVGVFSYNPYTDLNGKKVFLRPLGTEGQNIKYIDANGNVRKPYGSNAICIPIGFGIKYNVNDRVNVSFQVAQRLTTTDYIDDVSTTYVGSDKFTPNSVAQLLQDRSFEKGALIGIEGRQRGWSKQKDQFVIAEIGISLNLTSYKCPAASNY